MKEVSRISRSCLKQEHAGTNKHPHFMCDGNAYPGSILSEPIPCECGCHKK